MDLISEILRNQAGTISRRQLLDCDLEPAAIARLVRRRELTRIHPGVFVDHTGQPTWLERAWAAVLFSWPAALSHDSALRAVEGPGRRDRDVELIHVAVARDRRVVEPTGVRVHRVGDLHGRAQWNLGPPRIRYEHAVLDVAGKVKTDLDAIAVLADACGSRRSTAERLLGILAERPRQARRDWLTGVLGDVATGTCSVLEHGYLVHVERAHGLPAGHRQASHRHLGTATFRDVEYGEVGLVVELDAAAGDDAQTIRLSWGQVFERPCRTAMQLGSVLQRRGWAGEPTRCVECG